MIFVTVGSQKFQFNRLLKEVDTLAEEGLISDEIFAQTGSCTYEPHNMKFKAFLDRDEFQALMDSCDVVITHGGTGAIVGAIRRGKKTIAVPRLLEFDEHVDNHQIEIVSAFGRMGVIEACEDLSDLRDAYLRLRTKKYRPFVSNSEKFIEDLSLYIELDKA